MRGLYLVTDPDLIGDRDLVDVVMAAVDGGATCVQLRDKRATTRQLVEIGERLRAVLAPRGVPLVINDRVDVALAVGADGVHVGRDDMDPVTARALLGPEAIVGLSVESPADVERAEDLAVDYLGVSPVFDTPTKPDTLDAWGLDGLARVRRQSHHTIVAIGGIDRDTVADVAAAGADAVAVVSAVCAAVDPRAAAAELVTRFSEAARRVGGPR
ncbi:MAG TPA: thiamine phosphate synthase [Euzebyales bacterium]